MFMILNWESLLFYDIGSVLWIYVWGCMGIRIEDGKCCLIYKL